MIIGYDSVMADENGMEVSDGSSNPIIFLQKILRLVKWPKFALQIEFLQISYSHELKHLETFSILGKKFNFHVMCGSKIW